MKEESKSKILVVIAMMGFLHFILFSIFSIGIFDEFDLLNEKLGSIPRKAVLISLVEDGFEENKYFSLCLNDNAQHLFDKPGTTRFVIYKDCFIKVSIEDKKDNLIYEIGEILPRNSAVIYKNRNTALCRTIAESCEEFAVVSSGSEKTGEVDVSVFFKKINVN